MTIAKQIDVRANLREYFDRAYEGETIIVPRKQNKNVVIISEREYNLLQQLRRTGEYYERIFARRRQNPRQKGSTTQKEENLARLVLFSTLEKDWNGNGAYPIPGELIEKCTDLIKTLQVQPEIFPTAIPGIQLEFDNSRHDHMEIEINSADIFEIYIERYSGAVEEETIRADASVLQERVNAFYA